MAYIGNVPSTLRYSIDSFSGDGSNRDFTLRDAPVSPASIMVFVDGSYISTQQYTLTGSNLNLTTPPDAGTNNIQVIFLGITTAIGPVTDGSVTSNKLANGSVITDKLSSGSVTGDKLGLNSVSTNNIVATSITGDKLGLNSVSTNNIVATSITGDKLGLNSVSANNIAPNVFISVSNVTVAQTATFSGGVVEKANIVATGLESSIEVNPSSGAILYFTGVSSANATVNFVGLNSINAGNVTSFVVIVTNNNATRRRIETVQIDGQTQLASGASANLNWVGGLVPTPSANTDMYNFTIIKTSNTPTYNVFASVSTFKPT